MTNTCTRVLISFFSILLFGCKERPDTQVVFEKTFFHLGITPEAESVDCSVPFTIVGSIPVHITSVESSCSCTALSQDIIGKLLSPGVSYDLPLQIDTRGKVGFSVGLIVKTNLDQLIGITLEGIVQTPPKILPPMQICHFSTVLHRSASGTFETARIRDKHDLPLEPQNTVINGEYSRITLINSRESEHSVVASKSLSVVSDILTWQWELLHVPPANTRETVSISWQTDLALSPTSVTFQYVEVPIVPGFVKELYCGRLKPRERWSHTLNLDLSRHPFDDIAVIKSSSNSVINTRLEERESGLTIMYIDVQAPTSPGSFEAIIQVQFDGLEAPLPLRVYGDVES